MSSVHPRFPAYRLHKPSGLAVVTLNGRDVYLGRYGTPESRSSYDRRVAEWLASGRVDRDHAGGAELSVNEVMLAYVRFADGYYRDAAGRPTREPETMRLAFRPLKDLYGSTPAVRFGPLALKAVRQRLIDSGLARSVVNQRVGYVKRMFKWACGEELLPAALHHGLSSVGGLRRGRTLARETEPVGPVPDRHVDAVLPFLPPTVRAMVEVQRLTGMRSGELVQMRGAELDTSAPVWLYRPRNHKTAYLGRERAIALGPRTVAVLKPFLTPDPTVYLFSPRRARDERDAARRARRKSPVQPSQVNRRKPHPKRAPGEQYTPRSSGCLCQWVPCSTGTGQRGQRGGCYVSRAPFGA